MIVLLSPALDKPHAELKKATQQFEAHFLHTLLSEMRKTVPESTLVPESGQQRAIFQDMLDQTTADSMSQRGDFGLADMLYKQMAPTLGPEAASDKSR